MKRLICGVLSLFLLFSTVVLAQKGERITEDDPRWDCRTMGNKICGPGAKIPKTPIYCGAITKKGTSCKRRVKNKGDRCWQHRSK